MRLHSTHKNVEIGVILYNFRQNLPVIGNRVMELHFPGREAKNVLGFPENRNYRSRDCPHLYTPCIFHSLSISNLWVNDAFSFSFKQHFEIRKYLFEIRIYQNRTDQRKRHRNIGQMIDRFAHAIFIVYSCCCQGYHRNMRLFNLYTDN